MIQEKSMKRVVDIIVDVENEIWSYSKKEILGQIKWVNIYKKIKSFKTEFENIFKEQKWYKRCFQNSWNIIDEIVEDGNEAFKKTYRKFDKWIVKSDDELLISQDRYEKSLWNSWWV